MQDGQVQPLTFHSRVNQMVDYKPHKLGVAGSNPAPAKDSCRIGVGYEKLLIV